MRGVCGKYIEDLIGNLYEKSQLDSVPYENPEARNQKQDYILYKLNLEPSHTSSDKSLPNLEKLSEGVYKANALKPQFHGFPARSPPLFNKAALQVACYMHTVSITGFARQLDDNFDSYCPALLLFVTISIISIPQYLLWGDNMMTDTTQHFNYS